MERGFWQSWCDKEIGRRIWQAQHICSPVLETLISGAVVGWGVVGWWCVPVAGGGWQKPACCAVLDFLGSGMDLRENNHQALCILTPASGCVFPVVRLTSVSIFCCLCRLKSPSLAEETGSGQHGHCLVLWLRMWYPHYSCDLDTYSSLGYYQGLPAVLSASRAVLSHPPVSGISFRNFHLEPIREPHNWSKCR